MITRKLISIKWSFSKLLILLFLWTVAVLQIFNKSHSNVDEVSSEKDESRVQNHFAFQPEHDMWPHLARRNVSDLIDYSMPNFRPWIDSDPECGHFKNHFAKNYSFIPSVYLTSYPGSCNTWTRYLVESVTGFFSHGSDKMYPEMIANGFYGNILKRDDTGMSILEKTHTYNTLEFQSAILVLRNPFESMVSFRKLETVGKLENPDEKTAFNVTKWSDFKSTEIGSWYRHSMSYLKHPNYKFHVVVYDDLVRGTKNELLEILEFLEFPFDHDRLNCLMDNIEGSYHRKKPRQAITFPFTKDEADALETAVCLVNLWLKKLHLKTFRLQDFTKRMKEKYLDPESLIPDPFCVNVPEDENEAIEKVSKFLTFVE